MSEITAQITASEGTSYITTQDYANAANAQAYTSPAAMHEILSKESLLIEPSASGVPEPPDGGASPNTKIPGSLKIEGAGGSRGTRIISGTAGESMRKEFSGLEDHQEIKFGTDKVQQSTHRNFEQHITQEQTIEDQAKESRSAA